MIFASSIFLFILFSSYFNGKFKHSDTVWLTASAFLLCVFAGLRDVSFGSDLYQYFYEYNGYMPLFSYTSILNEYLQGFRKDGLFYFTMKLFYDMGISYQWFIASVTSFYILNIVWFIYKNSKNQILSLLMFLTLEWYVFSFTGLRQAVAMGFCVLALTRLLESSRDLWALLLIGIAGLFHSSAWIFFIAVVVIRFNLQITPLRFLIMIFVSLAIALTGQSFFRGLIVLMSWNSSLARYASSDAMLNWTGFFIQLAFAGSSYYLYYRTVRKYPYSASLYSVMAIGICFQTFSSVVAEMFRVSMYFSIASICAYPMAIASIADKRIRSLCLYVSYVLLFVYLIVSAKFARYVSILN